ncbi:hypothetical protein C3B59_17400 [Cryobacterium zongtaii]|uniref:VWFA domain-containing protein n=1 Tax=Cryobacterium zongtaii TaxID=1259217 RepID=A0A2S3Z5Z4_9MICO|nr:vWA domain-containing protein [Cryobacterium zongtaii]POH59668.1 hypothetical protein C3B59_17400 [Cryobacterium zongtaii]
MRVIGSRTLLARSAPGRLSRSGQLASATIGRGRRWPIVLAVFVPLLLLGLLGAALVPKAASPLADFLLDGPRSPGCVRLVLLRDQSGSMVEHAAAREEATERLLEWVVQPEVLRGDDEVAVIDWAGSAVVALPATRVSELSGDVPGTRSGLSDGTDVTVGIDAAAEMPLTNCRVAFVFLTDGFSEPVDTAAAQAMRDIGVASVATIVPSGVGLADTWARDFPYGLVRTVEAGAADRNAAAIAEALGAATGQRLAQR